MIALVPLKGFRAGKSRLSSVLDEEGRARLARWMLERVFRALAAAESVGRTILISRDSEAYAPANSFGAETFVEEAGDLNGALREAIAFLRRTQAENSSAVLIVPADVPLLTPEEVDGLAALAGGGSSRVVAAPSRRREGTNALFLRPAEVLAPSFGPDSFNRHRADALKRGIAFQTCDSPAIGLDIDLPEDLESLQRVLDPPARKTLANLLEPGPVASP